MITKQDHHDIVHLVAVPSTNPDTKPLGRLIPGILCHRAIQTGLTPPGQIVLVGDSTCESQAQLLGLQYTSRLTPPLGNPKLLRRRFRQLTRHAKRIVCWNDELASMLRGITADRDLISTLPTHAPSHISKNISIRVFEQQDREYWESREHIAEVDTLLPGVLDDIADDLQPIERATLGMNPDAICIGVLSDRPSDVDARELAFLMGLLNAAGYPLTGIVPNTASHIAAARRHHRGLGGKFQFLVIADPITARLPIFDAMIHPCFDGSGSSMLIERMCENADVPVLRLKQSAREGLSRAPAVAGPIIEHLDALVAEANQRLSTSEPINA